MSNDNRKMKGADPKRGSHGGESFWRMLTPMQPQKKTMTQSGEPTQQALPECVVDGIPECPPPGAVSTASS